VGTEECGFFCIDGSKIFRVIRSSLSKTATSAKYKRFSVVPPMVSAMDRLGVMNEVSMDAIGPTGFRVTDWWLWRLSHKTSSIGLPEAQHVLFGGERVFQ
jgi:hypothetical protein